MENGKLPDLSKLNELAQAPVVQELVITLYKNISFGVGPIMDEDGAVTGIMFDWFVPATPWKHNHVPFDRLSALDLIQRISNALSAGGTDAEQTELPTDA